jgi:ribonuclease E
LVEEEEEEEDAPEHEVAETAAAPKDPGPEHESEEDRGRRRRRRRRRRPEEAREARPAAAPQAVPEPGEAAPAGEEADKEGEAEAEKRRRRRGRRGGRTRPRREAAEAAAGAPVAAETNQIVPFAWEELDREAEIMPQPQPWAAEAGMESPPLTTAEIAPPAGESVEPAPQMAPQMALEHAGRAEHDDHHESVVGMVPTAEAEEGIPFASEAELVLEEAAAEAPAAHRGEPEAAPSPLAEEAGIAASDRPANPRRGWWQRLTQP